MPVECQKTKLVTRSKLNWTGLAMVILGAVTDPQFHMLFGNIIPQEWLSRIIFVTGWLVIGMRTFGANPPLTFNWKSPWT